MGWMEAEGFGCSRGVLVQAQGFMQGPGYVHVYQGGVMQINVYKDKCTELLEMMKMWLQNYHRWKTFNQLFRTLQSSDLGEIAALL